METTKMQEETSNHCIANKMPITEIMDKLDYARVINNDMTEIKKSMVGVIDAYIRKLYSTTEPTADNMARIYKELQRKYNGLKSLLTMSVKAGRIPDMVVEKHAKRVHMIMRHHVQLVTACNTKGMSSEVFVEKMAAACDLNRYVYRGIEKQVTVLLEELTPYRGSSIQGKRDELMDISNILMHELFMSEYTKNEDEELQELFSKYVKQWGLEVAPVFSCE